MSVSHVGLKFNELEVLSEYKVDGVKWFHCICSCGNFKDARDYDIKSGKTMSCGCYQKRAIKKYLADKNVYKSGVRVGRLIVLKAYTEKWTRWVVCQCDCGSIVTVRANSLQRGKTSSCGCLRREVSAQKHLSHGLAHTRIYGIWSNMLQRCFNPNSTHYKDYGGRGITICDKWLVFDNFYNDIKDMYDDNLQIDRIDVNGNYEINNVRFVDVIRQANNRRNNVMIEYQGKTQSLMDWSRELDIPYTTLSCRYKRRYPVDLLFAKLGIDSDGNVMKLNEHYLTYKGKTRNITSWSKIYGISVSVINDRLKKGWSVEKTLTQPLRQCKKH